MKPILTFLCALLLLLLPLVLVAAPPNILLIVSDDQGYRDRLQSDFNRRDTNKDGKLTLEELKNK